jgi:hypothetical protein
VFTVFEVIREPLMYQLNVVRAAIPRSRTFTASSADEFHE